MLRIGAVLVLLACSTPFAAQDTRPLESLRFDPNQVDKSIDPCTDFYQYACGKWMKTHPLPADRSAWDPYYELEEKNQEIVRGILEGDKSGTGPEYNKITAYYGACMDEQLAERKGLRALRGKLRILANVPSPAESAKAVATAQTLGAEALFGFYPDQDLKDSEHVIATIDYASLGMTDRDYYLRDDADTRKLREEYHAHIARMLEYSGLSHDAALAGGNAVLELETRMAQVTPTREQRRDPSTQYHKLTLDQLQALTPSWPWNDFFRAAGVDAIVAINVTSPSYLQDIINLWLGLGSEARRAYLRWEILHALALAMPEQFVREDFRFDGTVLRGAKEMQPRWKRCARLTNDALGEAVGKAFVERHFSAANKDRALAQIVSIQNALADDISNLDWMTDSTRAQAVRKLRAYRIKVGYPDHWRDYTNLQVRRDDPLGNAIRARRFEFARQMRKIGKPVDRSEWFALPQDVDGYQSAALVEIVFTAGLLQPPFFDPEMDDAVNFGAIGRAMGHEFTHGFDDHGRKFDDRGNLRDWWTPQDTAQFKERAQCFTDEYSQFVVIDEKKLNGALTLGENIADNGGLRLAYAALQHQLASKPVQSIDGFTPEQRLFLAFAETQCGNITDQTARNRLLTDPHAPGRWRVNGTVRNMPEFQKAFACKATDAMVSPHPCRMW